MAEKTILVCDVCGQAATQSVTIHAGSRRLVKDLCPPHIAELIKGARRVKRGRPRVSAAAAKGRGGRAKSAKGTSPSRKSRRKEAAA